jgi:hypothetical protein
VNPRQRVARENAQWMVDIWNAAFPIGAGVVVRKDDGRQVPTKTRGEAWVTDSGDPVVLVEGITGGYLLTRVQPAGPSIDVWNAIQAAAAKERDSKPNSEEDDEVA